MFNTFQLAVEKSILKPRRMAVPADGCQGGGNPLSETREQDLHFQSHSLSSPAKQEFSTRDFFQQISVSWDDDIVSYRDDVFSMEVVMVHVLYKRKLGPQPQPPKPKGVSKM